jgi:glycosyltransferase involved in cell wall biosynthesis
LTGRAPTVSVIIPAFNASPWISETIESVLAQQFTDFELIVVDDGSTDNTAETASAFGNRVRVLRKPNGGTSSARNMGILNSKGDYIAFLDADDLWKPEKLSLQVELLEATGLKWVYCDGYAFRSNSRKILFRFGRVYKFHKGDILEPLFLENFIPSGTPVIARSVFEELGCFDETLLGPEDLEMWLRIAAVYPTDFVSEPLFLYRIHEYSKSRDENLPRLMENQRRIVKILAKREAPRLAHLQNQSLAGCWNVAGRALARTGNRSEARRMFLRSIALYPYSPTSYLHFFVCAGGQPFVNAAVRFRELIRRLRAGAPRGIS